MSGSSQFTNVPPGKIAAVVTYLEMTIKPPAESELPPLPGDLRRVKNPDVEWYLEVYRRIGIDLLWFSRLFMPKEDIASIVTHPEHEVYALECGGLDEGLIELDFRTANYCELSFFGVTPKLVGTGVGRALMKRAVETAWSRPIERFWLHTCTLDHPRALEFYLRSGFTAYERKIEIADDPRLTGDLSLESAPQVPIIRD